MGTLNFSWAEYSWIDSGAFGISYPLSLTIQAGYTNCPRPGQDVPFDGS